MPDACNDLRKMQYPARFSMHLASTDVQSELHKLGDQSKLSLTLQGSMKANLHAEYPGPANLTKWMLCPSVPEHVETIRHAPQLTRPLGVGCPVG